MPGDGLGDGANRSANEWVTNHFKIVSIIRSLEVGDHVSIRTVTKSTPNPTAEIVPHSGPGPRGETRPAVDVESGIEYVIHPLYPYKLETLPWLRREEGGSSAGEIDAIRVNGERIDD